MAALGGEQQAEGAALLDLAGAGRALCPFRLLNQRSAFHLLALIAVSSAPR